MIGSHPAARLVKAHEESRHCVSLLASEANAYPSWVGRTTASRSYSTLSPTSQTLNDIPQPIIPMHRRPRLPLHGRAPGMAPPSRTSQESAVPPLRSAAPSEGREPNVTFGPSSSTSRTLDPSQNSPRTFVAPLDPIPRTLASSFYRPAPRPHAARPQSSRVRCATQTRPQARTPKLRLPRSALLPPCGAARGPVGARIPIRERSLVGAWERRRLQGADRRCPRPFRTEISRAGELQVTAPHPRALSRRNSGSSYATGRARRWLGTAAMVGGTASARGPIDSGECHAGNVTEWHLCHWAWLAKQECFRVLMCSARDGARTMSPEPPE